MESKIAKWPFSIVLMTIRSRRQSFWYGFWTKFFILCQIVRQKPSVLPKLIRERSLSSRLLPISRNTSCIFFPTEGTMLNTFCSACFAFLTAIDRNKQEIWVLISPCTYFYIQCGKPKALTLSISSVNPGRDNYLGEIDVLLKSQRRGCLNCHHSRKSSETSISMTDYNSFLFKVTIRCETISSRLASSTERPLIWARFDVSSRQK